MRALAVAFVALPAWALPPVTQDEAAAFHRAGLCVMTEPGKGITRPDGRGWIGAYYPGSLRITGAKFDGLTDTVDAVPGKVYYIVASGSVSWCPRFVMPGREACGPVPKAFLYDMTGPS